MGSETGVDAGLMRHGGLSYLEIPAADPARAAAFYAGALGWHVEEVDATWKFADGTGHLIGRWVTGRPAARELGMVPYFYVDHLRAVVARAVAAGGEVVREPYPEGNLLVATLRDPAGNVIGVWEAAG